MNAGAQGALEYLLVIGGAILVGAIVISLITAAPSAADPTQRAKCLSQKNWGSCDATPECTPMKNDMATEATQSSEFFICMAGTPCQNGSTRPCGTDTGECSAGIQTCTSGLWSTCTGEIVPQEEICGNGSDEDCDGQDLACAPNQTPTATLNADPTTGTAPLTVTFTGSCTDTDGTITSCSLDYGDGTPAVSFPGGTVNATHSYTSPNTYSAILTATDNEPATVTSTKEIIVATGCPNGTCSTGENCPADVTSCLVEPSICRVKTCTSGCGSALVPAGDPDTEGAIWCNGSTGCTTSPCTCNGAGTCTGVCGNGVLDTDEVCDTAMPTGMTNVTCNSSCSGYEIVGCGANLAKTGNYVVTQNISVTGQDCIVVSANDVVLDCDEKTLTGSYAGSGVWINGPNNVTVKNCNITKFWYGLRINGGTNNKLYENMVTSSNGTGIAIASTTNGELRGNNASAQDRGAEITNSSLSTTGNVFCGSYPTDIYCATSTFTGTGNRARRISGNCAAAGFQYSSC